MENRTRPFAPVALAAAGVALLAGAALANTPTPAQNKTEVEAKFEAWSAGTDNPFELLADNASWTIEGHSVAARTYRPRKHF